MGKEAAEIGFSRDLLVVRVAGVDANPVCVAAQDNGKIWIAHMRNGRIETVKAEKGAPDQRPRRPAPTASCSPGATRAARRACLEIPDISGPRQFAG
ncbi:hypothetical protein ACRAWD_04025 [Caulobacter segnis]